MKVEEIKRRHNLLVSRPNFILSSTTGILLILISTVLYFYSMRTGHSGPDFFCVLGITLGGLVFSYGSSAFKPWLVPFGLHVPQEKIIITKYIQICNSTIFYGITSSIFIIFMSLVEGGTFVSDINSLTMVSAFSLQSISAMVAFITFIVVPTKLKLSNLLIDKNIFKAEQRDIIRRLEKLGEPEKSSNNVNESTKVIGFIKKIKIWIYSSRVPVFRFVAIILPFLFVSFLIAKMFFKSNFNTNIWNSSTAGGLYIPEGDNFDGNFKNGDFYIKCNYTKIHVNIKNGIVESWAKITFDHNNSIIESWAWGEDVLSVSDENLEKLEDNLHEIEGEWFTTDYGDPNHRFMIHRYIKDTFWIEFKEEMQNGKPANESDEFPSICGGSFKLITDNEYLYEFKTEFASNQDMLDFPLDNLNGTPSEALKHNKFDGNEMLVNSDGGGLGRDPIINDFAAATTKTLQLQKTSFNLDPNKIIILQLNLEFGLQTSDNDQIEQFRQNELIALNTLMYHHFQEFPNATFDNYGHSSLIDKLNNYFNDRRSQDNIYSWMYPLDPVYNIIPQTILISNTPSYSTANSSE